MNDFFNVRNAGRLYSIVYNNKTGEILNVRENEKFIDSYNTKNNGYIDSLLSNNESDVDCLTTVTSLIYPIEDIKKAIIVNPKENRNKLIIKIGDIKQPVYPFYEYSKKIHLTSNAFTPNTYSKIFKDIIYINKDQNIKTQVSYFDSNTMGISRLQEEIFLESLRVDASHIIFGNPNKILIHISDPQYVIPKFYCNVLYSDIKFSNISQTQTDMISFNYDELWVTTQNSYDEVEDKIKDRIQLRLLRPGLDINSYLNFEIKDYPEYYEDEIKDKYVFTCICADSSRYDIESLVKSYFRAFNKNNDVILKIHIYPLNEEQFKCKSSRVKHYQSIIDELYTINSPRIFLSYGNLKIDDRKTLLKLSDCFISPSRAEGFCQEFIEAALMGVDQLVPNHTGFSDVLDIYSNTIPTTCCNIGTQRFDVTRKLIYVGEYQEITESADFNPAYFNSNFFNFTDNSIDFIVENMREKYNDKKYSILNTDKLKKKCIELYNFDNFKNNYNKYCREIQNVY